MYPAAQLSYSYDTDSTAGPEYIYNMLVTVYFDVTENPPEADPNISILEPLPGSTVEGIETIHTYIVTGASDIDIDSVAFYADAALLGSDTEAPFQWYWDTDSLADGEYTLTATAAFSNGESVTSEGVTVRKGEDNTPPTIVSITPADGALKVSVNAPIVVVFSEAIDQTTLNGSNIVLSKNGSSYLLSCQLDYDETTRTLTIDPYKALNYNSGYTCTLSDIADRSGNKITSKTVSFDTYKNHKTYEASYSGGSLSLYSTTPMTQRATGYSIRIMMLPVLLKESKTMKQGIRSVIRNCLFLAACCSWHKQFDFTSCTPK